MARYAEYAELEAYLGDRVPLPIQPEAERMLDRATELSQAKTGHWAEYYWVTPRLVEPTAYQGALSRAVIQQVEFWLEVGEEHDIVGLTGNVTESAGRSMTTKLPERP